jgi:Transposase DDE domain
MPYKLNETRRHKIPKARYRVANWPEYDAALVRRGSITVWLTEEAVEAWHAAATGERGGQPVYSAIAIETGLALRLVFHQPLRQTEGLLRSLAAVLGVDIRVPDHTTLSRRGGGLTILLKRIDGDEPLHLLVTARASRYTARANGWIRSMESGRAAAGASCTSALMLTRMRSPPWN